MKQSTIIAGLVGAIVYFFLNYLFYAVLGLTDSHVTEANEAASRGDDVLMLPLILGHLLMGVFLAQVYSKWARGTHNFMQGAQFGGALGLVFGLSGGIIWYATMNAMSVTGHAIEAIWSIVSLGIMGGVISIVMSRFESE